MSSLHHITLEALVIEYLQENDNAIGERLAALARTMTDEQWNAVRETAQLCCTRLEFIGLEVLEVCDEL